MRKPVRDEIERERVSDFVLLEQLAQERKAKGRYKSMCSTCSKMFSRSNCFPFFPFDVAGIFSLDGRTKDGVKSCSGCPTFGS